MANNSKNQNKQRTIIVVVAVVIITVFFFLLIDIDEVVQYVVSANPLYLAAASIALILGLVAFAARWRALLENKPGLLFTFHASNLGHAGNILIPFRAGEAIRILVMGSGNAVSYTEATTSFVVERLFEQIMRFLALGLAIFVGVGLEPSPVTVISGIGLLVLGFGVIAWLGSHQEFTLEKGVKLLAKVPRVKEESAHKSLSDLLKNLEAVSKPRRFAQILFISLVTWFLFWSFFFLTALALETNVPRDQALSISLAALALSPPSAPTQPGIFHASIVIPLAALGLNAEILTAYAVLLHILEMFWMIGFAIWGLMATGSSLGDIFKARN